MMSRDSSTVFILVLPIEGSLEVFLRSIRSVSYPRSLSAKSEAFMTTRIFMGL